MHLLLKQTRRWIVPLLLLLSFGLNSCKKSNSKESTGQQGSGPAKVIVNMLGIDENIEPVTTDDVANGKLAVNSKEVQQRTVSFNEDISVVATLVPVGSVAATGSEKNNVLSINATKPILKPAAIVQTPLTNGVKYRVVVYDNLGNYVTFKDYVYSNTTPGIPFMLDAGKQYTFVAYSINSTTATTPNISPSPTGLLANATLASVSGDLMYFRKDVMLAYGDNNLDIVLKHKYSQITTAITLDASITGNITAIGGVNFTGSTYFSASINLNSGNLTYPMTSTPKAVTTFTGVPGRTISLGTTLIISPGPTGILSIGSITIGNLTKAGLVFPDLNIIPGQKYNLNLTFTTPCTTDVDQNGTGNFNTNVLAGAPRPSRTISAPAADYGFQFDISKLDNSFTMVINNKPLIINVNTSSRELQFETYAGGVEGPAYSQNVQFVGGGKWGVGGIPQIYAMTGTLTTPVIRVVIGPTGAVSMYGSKVANGPLFPLELIGGFTFNTIIWNSTGTNTVTISQTVSNGTVLVGRGVGKKIVPCTN